MQYSPCPNPLLLMGKVFWLHCRLDSADVTLCESPIVISVHVAQERMIYLQLVLSQSCAGLSGKLARFSAWLNQLTRHHTVNWHTECLLHSVCSAPDVKIFQTMFCPKSNMTLFCFTVDYSEQPKLLKLMQTCLEEHHSYCINGLCAFHSELRKPICK